MDRCSNESLIFHVNKDRRDTRERKRKKESLLKGELESREFFQFWVERERERERDLSVTASSITRECSEQRDQFILTLNSIERERDRVGLINRSERERELEAINKLTLTLTQCVRER
jgi:hypothetical protein